ncbi:MAG: sugar transferase [Epsilonproteobacteria bacterium]|nr:sugar transferase [Campylobacterota bacterium]
MKNNLARIILIAFDVVSIFVSIVLAYNLATFLDSSIEGSLMSYTDKMVVYVLVILSFFGLQIYKYRHDFWEETYLVIKALFISLLMLFAFLALSKSVDSYSTVVIILSFMTMAIVIPTLKYILKKKLLVFGLWLRRAMVVSGNSDIVTEIFGNRYLGYIKSSQKDSEVVFVDTAGSTKEHIEKKLSTFIHDKKEIIFIPLLNSFNYSHAGIIEVFNARTNMIVLENSLLKKSNIFVKEAADLFMAVLLIPLLIPLFGFIIYLIRKEEPTGSIFFKQDRMGKNGKTFVCYKFRSMREDGDAILQEYLKDHPEEVENYKIYHKYENDPRITKIGRILRKTSLDELPQIINVFKGEMSLIGPRPYMLNEREKIGSKIEMVLAVKPGISGLWQVSGRSDVDFHSRVDMDVYYTRNWNLWLDFVIALKTVKTVLFREGAS